MNRLLPDEPWQVEARCAELVDNGTYTIQEMDEMFFPEQTGGSYAQARKICGNCAVRAECLVYGLETDLKPYGMFGGATPDERKNIAKIYPRVTQDIGEVIVRLDKKEFTKRATAKVS